MEVPLLNAQFAENVITVEKNYRIETPPEVLQICQDLNALGARALLVGGCVRDGILLTEMPELEASPKDFDIEVFGCDPDTLHVYLENAFGKENIDTVGKSFGILKVRIEGWKEPLDISIPRRESKTGQKHKEFSVEGDPTMTIAEAAKRRDLTINALLYDPLTQTVYDAFGGLEDIKNRRIDVTDVDSFQEDPLRVLRVMQFASRFGFEVTNRTRKLCEEMVEKGDLDHLPTERVTEEFKKLLLKGMRPSTGLQFARETGVTERYWPELHDLIDVQQSPLWHPEGDVWTHTLQCVDATVDIAKRERLDEEKQLVLALAVLSHDLGKPATTIFVDGKWKAHGHEAAGVKPTHILLNRFTLPTDTVREVLSLVPEHMSPPVYWEQEIHGGSNMERAVKRLAVRLGKGQSSIYMLSLVAEADQRGRNGKGSIPLTRENVPNLVDWQTWFVNRSQELHVLEKPPEGLVTGRMILDALDRKQGGPLIGIVLAALYEQQLDGSITDSDQGLKVALATLAELESMVQELIATGKNEREAMQELRENPPTFSAPLAS